MWDGSDKTHLSDSHVLGQCAQTRCRGNFSIDNGPVRKQSSKFDPQQSRGNSVKQIRNVIMVRIALCTLMICVKYTCAGTSIVIEVRII